MSFDATSTNDQRYQQPFSRSQLLSGGKSLLLSHNSPSVEGDEEGDEAGRVEVEMASPCIIGNAKELLAASNALCAAAMIVLSLCAPGSSSKSPQLAPAVNSGPLRPLSDPELSN